MHLAKGIRWFAFIAVTAAAAAAANVVLLGVAEDQDEPVGKLSRRVLIATTDQRSPPSRPTTRANDEPAVGPSTAPSDSTETDHGFDGETDDEQDTSEPGETDDD